MAADVVEATYIFVDAVETPSNNDVLVQVKTTEELEQDYEDVINDPITFSVMTDPVIAVDGITYERSVITAWFGQHGAISPSTLEALDSTALIPNKAVRQIISKRCPHLVLMPWRK
jgi:hypothetical protein